MGCEVEQVLLVEQAVDDDDGAAEEVGVIFLQTFLNMQN